MPSACHAQAATSHTPVVAPDIAVSSLSDVPIDNNRVTSGAETLHVLVGHSLFLNTRSRLRRVYISDPAILNSVTLSPTQIVVTAMTSGISSLVLLDEASHVQSYVVSSDVDVAGLRAAMSDAMRGDGVNVQGNGDRVTLSGRVGSDALADTAIKLAGLYSKDVANALTVTPEHPKQVRLKVRILEVDRTKALQMGINLFNPGGNTSFLASTTTSQYPSTSTLTPSGAANAIGTLTTSNPLNFLLYSSKLNLGATVQDLESKQILQILAEPTITTISGQKADFLSGGEFPFPVIQPGGAGSSPVVTIEFRPYGVKLEFTPIVNDDGTIRLKVAPEVSALDYTNAVTIAGYTIPALSMRRAETEVELHSEQSFAISGLLDQRTTDILNKTPGAANIPILGALFKSKNINHSTTELVVVITPTLVDPLTETDSPAQPVLPIRRLNTETFDESLGNNLNPQTAAPPINPAMSFNVSALNNPIQSGNKVPTNPPSTAPITSSIVKVAQNNTPDQSLQDTQAISPGNPTVGSMAATTSTIDRAQILSAPVEAAYGPYVPYQSSSPVGHEIATATSTAIASTSIPSDRTRGSALDSSAGASYASGHLDINSHASSRLMVQIMALSNAEDAESMVVALNRHGYNVAINRNLKDELFHLEVGPFTSKTDAESMRQRLIHDGYNAIIK
jgi:pilus assembly protein CpaC